MEIILAGWVMEPLEGDAMLVWSGDWVLESLLNSGSSSSCVTRKKSHYFSGPVFLAVK